MTPMYFFTQTFLFPDLKTLHIIDFNILPYEGDILSDAAPRVRTQNFLKIATS